MSLIEVNGSTADIASHRERKEKERRAVPAAITVGDWEDAQALMQRLAQLCVELGKRTNTLLSAQRATVQRLDTMDEDAAEAKPSLILPDRYRG